MGPEPLPGPLVPALVDQVRVELAERGPEPVRVAEGEAAAAGVRDAEVIRTDGPGRSHLEQALTEGTHRPLATVVGDDGDALGVGAVGAHHGAAARLGVGPEDSVGLGVVQGADGVQGTLQPGVPGGGGGHASPSAGMCAQSGRICSS